MTLAQAASTYDALVQQGKAQLVAGSANLALVSAEQAIKTDANRWEGYALAGGALMNLKQYEKAADMFSHAIDHAPEAKQTGLRELRRKCLLAESGASPTSSGMASAGPTTQAEIVLWKSIENSSNSADFSSYLETYPHGAFVPLAQRRLKDLKLEEEQTAHREHQELLDRSVWVDSSRDLMWTKSSSDASLNSKQADLYCHNLNLLGYSDWRLPTIDELTEIYDSNARGNIALKYRCQWGVNTDGKLKTFDFNKGKTSGVGGSCGTAVRGALCVRSSSKDAAARTNKVGQAQ